MREFLQSFAKLEFAKVKKQIQQFASSSIAQDLLEQLVPSSSPEEIRNNLAYVSEMKRLLEEHEYPPLNNIHDIRVSLQRTSIDNFILSSDDINKTKQILETSQKTQNYFRTKSLDYPLLHRKITDLYVDKILQYNINQAIDDNGLVKDSATKELLSIRRKILEKKDSLRSQLENILKSLSDKDIVQEDIITTRDGRMVIPIKSEHKKSVPGFIHSSSASGATVFIEPSESLDLNNDLRTLQFQEQREIEKILKELTQQIRIVKDNLIHNISLLGYFDFVVAKSKYSISIMGVEPVIVQGGRLRLSKARHPLLFHKHKREEVVPLDFEFSESINTIVITGPNAGGKSVALKTVGLLAIMAQSGCHIPAESDSQLPVFNEIFVDMGDEQSIENDLSSFSSHLTNLKLVLSNASPTSLILMDEIGSGTDPLEGASIAAVILDKLTSIGSKTIATTHHGSLKTFAFETPNISNAAMEFDQSTLRPTYRFRLGIPGSSYALEMAERLQFPQELISKAKELRGEGSNKMENLILDLEQKSQELAKKLSDTVNEKLQLKQLTEHYQNQITSLNKEIKSIRLKAADEAKGVIEKANSVVENAVREIREKNAEKLVVSKVKKDIHNVSSEINLLYTELQVEESIDSNFAVGDIVKLKSTNTLGKIIEIVDKNYVLLLIGDLKARVQRKELLKAVEPVSIRTIGSHISATEPFKPEIDLRGMYGDDAISEVERFLDKAILSGLQRVDIIHGKGTGALRKKVTDFLKKNSTIKSFRLGEWNEGGSGVTVVELQ